MVAKNKRLFIILLSIFLLLLIPLVAMQFTSEVKWTPFDFMVAGGLLLSTGIVSEFFLRKVEKTNFRLILIMGVLLLFILIWLELAVGIFGSPLSGS